jgi:hypothetical protein
MNSFLFTLGKYGWNMSTLMSRPGMNEDGLEKINKRNYN